jgi:hypothetical protein
MAITDEMEIRSVLCEESVFGGAATADVPWSCDP